MVFNTQKLTLCSGLKLLVALCAISLLGCSRSDEQGQCNAAPQVPVRQVVIIGIDGLRADAVSPALTPFLFRLAESHGLAWGKIDVSNGRTQQTYSAPGWVSVLTASWATAHGIVDNSSAGPIKVQTVFERLQGSKADSRSVLMTSWKPLYDLVQGRLRSLPEIHHAAFLRQDDAAIEQEVLTTWRACQPELAFIHLDAVDKAGHNGSFDPSDPGYAAAVRETDSRIRRLWEKAFAPPSTQGATPQRLVIFASDHGGVGNSHGRYSDAERWAPLLAISPSGYPAVKISSLVDIGQVSLDFVQ
ncbi:alkaline phosphatase family protein [Pseudomonas sp. OV226]|uniref:alkaline phosphatase family protein n=1 Tax=Pseudomonas sp. OV226 TaxID=2135588 RepID=UPI000D6D6BB0|nr:alkaline phosphatase [Pseudomonas sp. OV226]PWK45637.1 type I phosphodiesterase/nucleotide pyrophosphatase [Pseudomonas sp. OV226]